MNEWMEENFDEQMKIWMIISISIGGILGLALLVIIILVIVMTSRKKRQQVNVVVNNSNDKKEVPAENVKEKMAKFEKFDDLEKPE